MNLWRRLRYLLIPSYRNHEERDLQEELESLRAMARPGELGNLTLAAEDARGVWGWNWLDNFGQDLRYSLRTHRRHWPVTLVALFSLAFGIGANTLGFSLLNTLLLRPLPFPDSERLVVIGFDPPDQPRERDDGGAGLSRANCMALREQKNTFEHFGCFASDISASLGGDDAAADPPERVRGQLFTAGLARALGVNPVMGRWFTESNERHDADPVLLISYNLWQRRFGGSSDVLGKRVLLDGEAATIIGVMPDDFEFLILSNHPQFWIPLRGLSSGPQSAARIFGAVARLREGVQIQRAKTELDGFMHGLGEISPDDKGWRIYLQPLDVYVPAQFRTSALTLQGIVAFVLLIACANVAGLLLTQSMTQHRELAVRVSLGSNRWRIVRQLLTHSLVLAVAGGFFALAIAWWGLQILRNTVPNLPRSFYTTPLDSNVLFFTFLVSIVCGLIAGVAPAFQMSRVNPQDALQQQSSRVTSGIIHQKLQSMFVVAQVALAFTLLTGAGLMLNSQIRIANERIGFAVDDLLAVQLDFPDARFRRPTGAVLASNALAMEIDPQIRITAESIRQSLEALPNVISASGIAIFPPMGGAMNMPIHIDGPTEAQQRAQFLPVLAGYFQTLQVPLFQGREFGLTDTAGSTPVAIISETMARRFWPNENPLGKHVQIESPMLPDERSREIIGIVGEVKQYLGQEPRPQLYLPYTQVPLVHDERLTNGLRNVTFVLRTSSPAAPMMASIKAAVRSVDAGQAVSYVQSMRQTAFGNQRRRVYAGFVITFGAIAVILAMIGVYGVIAQTVNQRTNEIGIRMALGADTWRVRRLVIRHGVMMIGAGLLCGTAGALALTRLIRDNLFGITPTDPLTFGAALTVLAAIALAACYIPARRASRIDPVLALRHE